MRSLVIGLGKSGQAAALWLKHQGWEVLATDRSNSGAFAAAEQALTAVGVEVQLGYTFNPNTLPQPDLTVVSPGVPWDLPALVQAREQGWQVIGEVELAWRSLSNYPWVGITGTNGKTTTTALTAALFQGAGLGAPACGNIGYAACEVALKAVNHPPDWVIAEISSYQIEATTSVAPRIGVWTTFTPDHLERHHTLENYARIKAQLLERSTQVVLNADDPYLEAQGVARWPQAWWTSIRGAAALPGGPERGVYLEDGWVVAQEERILPQAALKMPGAHNQQNLLLAIAVGRIAGLPPAAMERSIAEFPGVPHRLELVHRWRGIEFINDSKATNYDAALVGLKAVTGPVVLIAGGDPKLGDDQAWLDLISIKTTATLLIGRAAEQFAQRLAASGYHNYEILETMARAVPQAGRLALDRGAKVVLLSPACASFDQYQNFEQRGDHFRALCREEFSQP